MTREGCEGANETHQLGRFSDMASATSSASSRLGALEQRAARRWRGRAKEGSNATASQHAWHAALRRPRPSSAAAALLTYAARLGSSARARLYL